MSAEKRHSEEITIETGHRARSWTIFLIIAIATIGLWYLMSDRD